MQKDSIRHKILNTAAVCFSKNGFHRTSVDEIAAIAKVAKGSVYYNFNNKEDLLYEVIKWGIELLNNDIEKIYSENLSDEDTFYQVLKIYAQNSLNYPELSSLVFSSVSDILKVEAATKVNTIFNELIDSTAKLLLYGANSGFIKDMNFHLAAVGMFGMINNMCRYYNEHLKDENREIVYKTIYKTFYNGIVKKNKD